MEVAVSSPELEPQANFPADLLYCVGPYVLRDGAELDLDCVAFALNDEMQRPVAGVLGFRDVVPDLDDCPGLAQAAAHGVDVARAWQHRANTADVVHLGDAALLSRELPDH